MTCTLMLPDRRTKIVHDRAVQDLEPARARRLADDDLGDVVGAGEGDDVVGDAPRTARDRDGLAAEPLGEAQRVGDPVALLLAQLQAAPRLDARAPSRARAAGRPARLA